MRLWRKVLEGDGNELGKENEAIEGNWSDRIKINNFNNFFVLNDVD